MTSKLIASAVLAAAALTSVAASAESFNPYLWDQMKAPATKTRAQVIAETLQAPQDVSATAPSSADTDAAGQQKPAVSSTEKAVSPRQANPLSMKTGG
jgi:3-methyladenine DNA glycosylase Tag